MTCTTKVPHRCNNRFADGTRCRARRSLAKRIERYIRPPKCRNCGSNKHWYVDEHRQRRRERFMRDVCRCDAFWYPHRKGSDPWCIEHPTGPTEEQQRERYQSVS